VSVRARDPFADELRIAEISAATLRIPLKNTSATSTREIRHREWVLVRVRSEDGAEGIGYTYAGTSGGLWLQAGLDELIAPLLVGRDARAAEENWERVYNDLLLLGRRGALLRALSAVDIAVWDMRGRHAGVSLREMLGGSRDRVDAYASGGYYVADAAVPAVISEIERYQSLGFQDFKIKVGGMPLTEDVARVRAARMALGPSGRLAIDVNNAWRSVEEAKRAISAFAPFELWWIEEPFLPDDLEDYVALVRANAGTIATGELESTRWGFARIASAKAAHILQPDACAAGGVTEWLKIALLADAHRIPVAPHWHANIHAQLAATTSNCLAVEYFAPQEGAYNFEVVVANPLRIRDGAIMLDSEPGIGVVLDEDAVARFTVTDR
jgi:L-alanine-DL-glutamate epimerase-like enolase superfamily enzyme